MLYLKNVTLSGKEAKQTKLNPTPLDLNKTKQNPILSKISTLNNMFSMILLLGSK